MLENPRADALRSQLLQSHARSGLRHGFFTRQGGVSTGIFKSLNVGRGSRDDPAAVEENRRRVAGALGVVAENLVTVHQVHSPDVVSVNAPFEGARPQADALVTDRAGIALGVLTADCGPVLFADIQAHVVGAAHAGWKGAFTGVLENTIEAMIALGARRERIEAALGPSIGPRNYEVGPEFVERFVSNASANAAYFTASTRPGHSLFDLNRYTLDRLRAAGIAVDHVARCTYGEPGHFFSYRRATHNGETDYGRQISAIVLET